MCSRDKSEVFNVTFGFIIMLLFSLSRANSMAGKVNGGEFSKVSVSSDCREVVSVSLKDLHNDSIVHTRKIQSNPAMDLTNSSQDGRNTTVTCELSMNLFESSSGNSMPINENITVKVENSYNRIGDNKIENLKKLIDVWRNNVKTELPANNTQASLPFNPFDIQNLHIRKRRFLSKLKNKVKSKISSLKLTTTPPLRASTPSLTDIELKKIVREVGAYLAGHKFFDVDHRYFDLFKYLEKKDEEEESYGLREKKSKIKFPDKVFMKHFPVPRLKRMPPGVERECARGVIHCLLEVHETLMQTSIFEEEEKQGGFVAFVKRIWNKLTKDQEKEMLLDSFQPFNNPLSQFQYRATASYYMCWYTMQRVPELEHFGRACAVDSRTLGQKVKGISDFRANDKKPFDCALLSFCPDPCCGKIDGGMVDKESSCLKSKLNPCVGVADGTCRIQFSENHNFEALTRNLLNYTCDCPRAGFTWNIKLRLCVDIDECYDGIEDCKENEICLNTVGSFKCVCRRGFIYNEEEKRCKRVFKEFMDSGDAVNEHSLMDDLNAVFGAAAKTCTAWTTWAVILSVIIS